MKNNKLIYKIFLSLCYVMSAASFFFPFFKITIKSSFGTINADFLMESIFGNDFSEITSFSPFTVIKLCMNSSEFIDASKLFIVAFFFFIVPFFLALICSVCVVAIKNSKNAGMISGASGFAGALLNILMRVFLTVNKFDFFGVKMSLSNILSVELAANISLALFIVAAAASIGMVFLFKNDTAENQNIAIPSQLNPNEYQNMSEQEAVWNSVNIDPVQPADDINNSNQFVENDRPTERVTYPESMFNTDDPPTERVIWENQYPENQVKPGIIECVEGMYKGTKFPININEEIIIGRDSKQSNIVLDKKYVYVSKKHCSILYESSARFRVKVFSSNGMFVNGKERLEQGTETYLSSGTVISVGNRENSFKLI